MLNSEYSLPYHLVYLHNCASFIFHLNLSLLFFKLTHIRWSQLSPVTFNRRTKKWIRQPLPSWIHSWEFMTIKMQTGESAMLSMDYRDWINLLGDCKGIAKAEQLQLISLSQKAFWKYIFICVKYYWILIKYQIFLRPNP